MGHQLSLAKGCCLAVAILLNSCDTADMEGMFFTHESVNYRFEQSMQWNARHPSQQITVISDDYTILSMGDSHIGGCCNLKKFTDSAGAKGVIALVMDGDLTNGHPADFVEFQKQLPRSEGNLSYFLIAGNHDLYFGGWDEYYTRFGSSTYTFTVQTPAACDLYICLDMGSGTLGDKQLTWLKDVLKNERPKYRRCIVFSHNNFFRFRRIPTTCPNIEEVYVLIDLFVRYRVDMSVSGHDHEKYEERFGNTTYIVMDALADGLGNAGYLSLRVRQGEPEYKFVNF